MSTRMTKGEFTRLAQTYGSSIKYWPPHIRKAADEFKHYQPDTAQHILDAERSIDAALAQAPQQTSNPALEGRVLHNFRINATTPAPHANWFSLFALWGVFGQQKTAIPVWGMALTLLLVCGFVGGYTGYSYALGRTSSTEIIANAFGTEQTIFFEEDGAT